jgi:hypothetical protein
VASLAERYILLGLRLGRHEEGIVDAYYGPEGLSREVDAEPLTGLAALVSEADELLSDLEDGWLRDQAQGLRTFAGVLAGEQLGYSDEVERCYGVRPGRVSTEVYAAAHERLDALLPGAGPLAERSDAWQRSRLVPAERVVVVFRDIAQALRERTRALVELPEGEEAEVAEVRDKPWMADNAYSGGLRSRVAVNVDLPLTGDEVVELAAHELYPGHHTESSVKDQRLLQEGGLLEESIQLVPTPASLVSEGIAKTGPGLVLDDELFDRLEAIFRRYGVDEDIRRARAVREARRPLDRTLLDVALLLHEDGGSAEEGQAYFARWGLDSPEYAAHGVRFLSEPTSRAYAITYSAGHDLCEAWVGADPSRFARLLTEHVRVPDLVAAISSMP